MGPSTTKVMQTVQSKAPMVRMLVDAKSLSVLIVVKPSQPTVTRTRKTSTSLVALFMLVTYRGQPLAKTLHNYSMVPSLLWYKWTKKGRSRGWGTVKFGNADDATNGMNSMNGTQIEGRAISIR